MLVYTLLLALPPAFKPSPPLQPSGPSRACVLVFECLVFECLVFERLELKLAGLAEVLGLQYELETILGGRGLLEAGLCGVVESVVEQAAGHGVSVVRGRVRGR